MKEGVLPDNLKILSIGEYYNHYIKKYIYPINLKKFYTKMDLKYFINELPDNLRILEMSELYHIIEKFLIFPPKLI